MYNNKLREKKNKLGIYPNTQSNENLEKTSMTEQYANLYEYIESKQDFFAYPIPHVTNITRVTTIKLNDKPIGTISIICYRYSTTT